MILIILGTHELQFTRLLKEVDFLIAEGKINEEVVAQIGNTRYTTTKYKTFDFINKNELNDLYSKASLIITHGGVGSIIQGLRMGKKVISIPRLKQYMEHNDDHQLQIVNEFSNNGYILGCIHLEELSAIIDKSRFFIPNGFVERGKQRIIDFLRDYIDNL